MTNFYRAVLATLKAVLLIYEGSFRLPDNNRFSWDGRVKTASPATRSSRKKEMYTAAQEDSKDTSHLCGDTRIYCNRK